MIQRKKPLFNDAERGTGRTKRMVMSLPEGGCVVVVHTPDFIRYVRNMIGDLRGAEFLKSVRLASLSYVDNLHGLDLPIYIDHFVVEYAWDRHLRRELEILLELQRYYTIRNPK